MGEYTLLSQVSVQRSFYLSLKWICQVGFIIPVLHMRKIRLKEFKTVESPGKCRSWLWASGGVCDAAFLSSPWGAMPWLRVLRRHSEKTSQELWGHLWSVRRRHWFLFHWKFRGNSTDFSHSQVSKSVLLNPFPPPSPVFWEGGWEGPRYS